jgi:hypothetical protein
LEALPVVGINEWRDGIRPEKATLHVGCRIESTDAFGDFHFTNVWLYSTGDDFARGQFRSYSRGNDSG